MPRFDRTTRKRRRSAPARPDSTWVLTVAHHPDPARVGQQAALDELSHGQPVALGRLSPLFAPPRPAAGDPGDAEPVGLDDPFVSRTPLELVPSAGSEGIGLRFDNPANIEATVCGRPLGAEGPRLAPVDLETGVVVSLGGRVVLVLEAVAGPLPTEAELDDDLGMHGSGAAIAGVRRQLRSLAGAGADAILLRAETGAGKELCARAVHALSGRRGPFVAVNLAALSSSVAAAELFGHEKGAFTGADDKRLGYFRSAEGGTLFLDEVGEASLEVQTALLRALDQREVQPVGGSPVGVDAHVVAATDADLEAEVAAGRFRSALLHRLDRGRVEIPPLRRRRADIGPLFHHFLAEALTSVGRPLVDQSLEQEAWPPTSWMEAVVLFDWPGNVRQLKNEAIRLAQLGELSILAAPSAAPAGEAASDPPASRGDAAAIDDERLLEVLRRHRFQLNRAAEELGIGRVRLDKLIDAHPRLQKAKDLTDEELNEARAAVGDDVVAMAEHLEVSVRGLKLRLKAKKPAP